MIDIDNKLANLATARIPAKILVACLAAAFIAAFYLLWRSL